jgi:hypothetical protein
VVRPFPPKRFDRSMPVWGCPASDRIPADQLNAARGEESRLGGLPAHQVSAIGRAPDLHGDRASVKPCPWALAGTWSLCNSQRRRGGLNAPNG